MYNLELTANKVGFCLYTLVMSVCLSALSQGLQERVEIGMFACMASLPSHPHGDFAKSKTISMGLETEAF